MTTRRRSRRSSGPSPRSTRRSTSSVRMRSRARSSRRQCIRTCVGRCSTRESCLDTRSAGVLRAVFDGLISDLILSYPVGYRCTSATHLREIVAGRRLLCSPRLAPQPRRKHRLAVPRITHRCWWRHRRPPMLAATRRRPCRDAIVPFWRERSLASRVSAKPRKLPWTLLMTFL